MSVLPNSETFMAPGIRNGDEDHETFHKFFECWLVEQNQHLQELVSASKGHEQRGLNHPNTTDNGETNNNDDNASAREAVLRPLIDKVIRHYELYYRAKSRWAKQDVLAMLSPSWRTALEDAFLWIGGWRPSMAFHLLYSKSGLQLEARLAELIRGLSTGDLGDLSPSQMSRVDELQRRTVREEKEITEKMAKLQETVADASMIELSHVVSESMRNGEEGEGEGDAAAVERVDSTLAPKEHGLEEMLHRADEIRLRTLKDVVEILSPIQAVHFLIAAAELHLRLHDWGKRRDAINYHHNNHHNHHAAGAWGGANQQPTLAARTEGVP